MKMMTYAQTIAADPEWEIYELKLIATLDPAYVHLLAHLPDELWQRYRTRCAAVSTSQLLLAQVEHARMRVGSGVRGIRDDDEATVIALRAKHIAQTDHNLPVTQVGAPPVDPALLGGIEGAHGVSGVDIQTLPTIRLYSSYQVMADLARRSPEERDRLVEGYDLPEGTIDPKKES